MADVLLKRVAWGLVPADLASQEAVKAIPVNAVVRANVKGKVRNYEHLKKWWALMGLVAENWPHGAITAEQVCEKVKLGIGHFDWIDAKLPGEKKPVKIPVTKSISFAQMNQDQFNTFYDQGVEFVRANLWPTETGESIRQMVEEFAS